MIPKNNKLFSASGCLTGQAINEYLNGSLSATERKSIEAHLKNCQICSEAIKGFQNYRNTTFIRRDIEFLSGKIRKRFAPRHKETRLLPFMIVISVILSLIILVIIYYIIRQYLLSM
jgi:hypothetical protein